jgi:hypothetical protein
MGDDELLETAASLGNNILFPNQLTPLRYWNCSILCCDKLAHARAIAGEGFFRPISVNFF